MTMRLRIFYHVSFTPGGTSAGLSSFPILAGADLGFSEGGGGGGGGGGAGS